MSAAFGVDGRAPVAGALRESMAPGDIKPHRSSIKILKTTHSFSEREF
jgi:hypothetical protein